MLVVVVVMSREVDQDQALGREVRRPAEGLGQSVGTLEGRQDAFAAGQRVEGGDRLGVGSRCVLDAAEIVQLRELGPDRRIVEPGGDRVRGGDLALVIT